jgi:hypothetical protein
VVDVGEGRELREVGHAQHLPGASPLPPGQPGQLLPHGHGGRAADAGVDLVEDQHAGVVDVGERDLDRERHPRAFAAGGACASGRAGSPGLGASRKVTRSPPSAVSSPSSSGSTSTSKRACGMARSAR